MQVSHRLAAESAVFDEDNLVSSAGLVPVMTFAGVGRPGREPAVADLGHAPVADEQRGCAC